MTRRILLLRGVNVGGTALPMAEFRAALQGVGLLGVRSYIQSGNAVFDDPGMPDLRGAISTAMKARCGMTPVPFLYDRSRFAAIIAACPYAAEGDADGTRVHVIFLSNPVLPNLANLQARAASESFALTAQALYLHAPDCIGRSKLAEALPRALGTGQTARNWNTVRALDAMARED